MRREIIKINLEKIKKKKFLKNEIKLILLKSIFQNLQTPNTKRFFIKNKISSLKKTSLISYQKNRCILSGNAKGNFKKFNINRHQIKQLNNIGNIQNVTTKKW